MTQTIELLKQDVDEIYLGNLGTVDTDLKLPVQGKRGSSFQWESDEILFISHKGAVTRPTYGVGNREVKLTVTASYHDEIVTRQFTATVLEEIPQTQMIRAIDIEETVTDSLYRLPSVCVVELDNHNYTTAEVTWNEPLNPQRAVQIITGSVNGTTLSVTIKLTFKAAADISVPDQLISKPTKLDDGSVYQAAACRMLMHLREANIDQLLYSFRSSAGLPVNGARPMTGWDAPECNLRGHTTGHYLSALSLAYYATKEEIFNKKIDYLVAELGKCQEAMEARGMHKGFLSAYSEEQFDLLEQYTRYPTIWAPYYTLEKIMNGLLDSYEYAGSRQGLTIAVNIGDWISARLGRLTQEQLSKMWSTYIAGEFGAMITAMMRLYHITRNKSYKATAMLFENDKLYIPIRFDYDTLDGVHANQHIPQIIGALDIYEETGNEKYLKIAENFWNMVVNHHSYSIGGVGETEMFKQKDQIARYLTHKTAESCASHNMLKLTKKLHNLNPRARYFDYYENTLHNHLLAATSYLSDGGTTYFMPLAPKAKKRFDTAENTCCHGTGLETLLRFQKDIYSFCQDTCYVNLFYASEVEWTEKDITIHQEKIESKIVLQIDGRAEFTLKVRIPKWMNIDSITIDGEMQTDIEGEYYSFEKAWNNNKLIIQFEERLQIHPANDDPNYFSISYGPDIMVYCGQEIDYIRISELELSHVKRMGRSLKIGNRVFIPINQVRDEYYHTYFRKAVTADDE